jgi:hypothetical protein
LGLSSPYLRATKFSITPLNSKLDMLHKSHHPFMIKTP